MIDGEKGIAAGGHSGQPAWGDAPRKKEKGGLLVQSAWGLIATRIVL